MPERGGRVREMADVDAGLDHRPRIVAVIPKKMHVDEQKERGGARAPQTTDLSQRNCRNFTDGRRADEPSDAKDATDPTSARRARGANARAPPEPPRRENSFGCVSPRQQKRVPHVGHAAEAVKRVQAAQMTGYVRNNESDRDERDGVGQRGARASIQPSQPVRPIDRERHTSTNNNDEEERIAEFRREYWYDKDQPNCDLAGLIKNCGVRNMATVSPKPAVTKTEKEESIWDKLGTLGRKKRIKEVQEVQEEGKHAIDSPGFRQFLTTSPEDYDLEENEERCMIDQSVYSNPQFIKLVNVLINWINDELASQRIIVQDLAEDLYDGQVLQKLLEKLNNHKLDVREVTQSAEGQKQKLHAVLSYFNHVLGLTRTGSKKWNVEAIHSKNIVSIMHLLVALARHFRPPVRLTEHVSVPVVIVKKVRGMLEHRTVTEVITTSYDDVGLRWERDSIDSLFDHAPDKLQVVKKSMVTFVNKHLTKLGLEITEVETQFHDGVYLVFLMGLLEGFFVPLHAFHMTPQSFDQKVHNVVFAFELMEDVGITKLKARPEDIVNQDLKSTLRVLYTLFMKYKNL